MTQKDNPKGDLIDTKWNVNKDNLREPVRPEQI